MATVIIDYESGNLHSVQKAFQRMAQAQAAKNSLVTITSDPETVRHADRVVLPGDGAFPACRQNLFDHRGLFEALEEAVIRKGTPFMGICIGMQMLAGRGLEYGETPGFDWIGGTVAPISPEQEPTAERLKVPHMGWNDLSITRPHPILAGVSTGDHAYFVHSYHFQVANPAHSLAHVEYGGRIAAIVGRDNILGVQFHPEKSQRTGLRIIQNFLSWTP